MVPQKNPRRCHLTKVKIDRRLTNQKAITFFELFYLARLDHIDRFCLNYTLTVTNNFFFLFSSLFTDSLISWLCHFRYKSDSDIFYSFVGTIFLFSYLTWILSLFLHNLLFILLIGRHGKSYSYNNFY